MGGSIPDGPTATDASASSGGGGVSGGGGQPSSGGVFGGGGSGAAVTTGGVTGVGGSSAMDGGKATGGGAGAGGVMGTGGGAGTGGVASSGGIATGGVATGGTIQDASVPRDCACTLENDVWRVSLDCLCTVRDCGVTLLDFQAGGRLEGAFWYLEEFEECGLAREVETTPQIDITRTFDLTTGRLVGQHETVNAGALCPFGADAGETIFWLSAGQSVPSGCVPSRCIDGSYLPGHCS